MGSSGRLTEFIMLMMMSTATAIIAAAHANPSCQRRCGNLSVPYPFGTEKGCFMESEFFIRCNNTVDPPQAFLQNSTIDVLGIYLDGQLRIQNRMSFDCYDQSGRSSYFNTGLKPGLYNISNTKNKFIAIGCDTNAVIRGSIGQRGCLSICYEVNGMINRSCSGIGCCQANIPTGVRDYDINLDSYNNHSDVLSFNPCSYAFIVEDGAYNFSTSDLNSYDVNRKFPMILDWTIGNQSCCEAKKDPGKYACKENSYCFEPKYGNGYLCRCSNGFRGNPYLSDEYGCKDIDECETLNPCNSTSTCHNTIGSFYCSRPERHEGDGLRDGTGGSVKVDHLDKKVPFVIGICSGLGILFLLLGNWWLSRKLEKRKNIKLKEKFFKRNGGLLFQKKLCSHDGGLEKAKLFTSKELEIATDQYNENRILGCGGQGMVYKGMLQDGRIVAVKKSKIVNEGHLEQFINEIVILSQIDHRNVVKLLGCCLETEVPLLVYEFIPNGTLSHLIHDQNEEYPRSWDVRLRIAAEVASAISHLHSSASVPIYHRDIKSNNILLDEKFRAKVSDFGTSRSIGIDQTHVTTQVQGTFGYLDPEYFQSNQFTEKSDVYSFGVVLVEILTGRKPISTFGTREERGLVSCFISSMEENHLLGIIDAEIVKDGQREELVAVAHLANRCLNLDGRYRPTMKEVAMELERIRTLQGYYIPIQPKQGEYVVTKPIESWDFTSFSMEPGITSDVHPLMFDTV